MATSYTFRTSDLPKLDLDTDRGSDFAAWHQQWLAYRSLSGLADEPQTRQVQALQLCFSRETLNIVENLGLTNAQKEDQAQIIAAIKAHVDGQINETVERRNLRQRKQQPGEAFDDFLVSLRELAKTCNFCSSECLQKAIRDQIIEGLSDGETVQELLQTKDLKLDQTITKCRGMEAAKKSRAEIQGQRDAVYTLAGANQQNKCMGCGGKFHDGGRKNCPAYKKACRRCGKIGHYSLVCRQTLSPNRPVNRREPTPRTNSLSTSGLPSIRLTTTAIKPAPTIGMNLSTRNGQATIKVLPDSGSDICAAGPHLVHALNEHMDNLADSAVTPKAVNGSLLHPVGKIPQVTFEVDKRTATADVHVYKSISSTIVSWSIAQKLGILPTNYPSPAPAINKLHLSNPEDSPAAESIMMEFPSVFDGQIRVMPGEKFQIRLTDNAKPFCVTAPRTIPFAYRDKLKNEIDLLVQQGIIAPVTEPTEWCAPIVVTPKKNSEKIRMCVDLSRLNKYVKRERYPSVTPAAAVADIAQTRAKYFTVFDALKGYHQCPLDERSQKLTTFITPFGRFKYLRAPYGISSISEHYNRRMDEAFADLPNFRKIVDDVVIFDADKSQHIQHVRQFLRRCEERGISLNKEKFLFCQTEVPFAGFKLTPEGYTISSDITDAISKFPTPSSRTDLRSFFGLVNQLASSTNEIARALAPLRPLLSSHNEFLWSPVHDDSFAQAKAMLVTAPTLTYFDITKETCLHTDASTLGIGFVLRQRSHETDATWRTIQAGSRFLTDTESRYAVIELECLAVAWAVKKCSIFLSGLDHFTIVTDHNPLILILNSHRLDEIENPRLQRLRTRLMAFNFTAQWLKGKDNEAADALSRHPHQVPHQGDELAEQEVNAEHPHAVPDRAPSISEIRSSTADPPQVENLHTQELRKYAGEDEEYQGLKRVIKAGFPNQKSLLPASLQKFWAIKEGLTVDDDLVVYGCRLLVPINLRPTMLTRLHEAHQGVSRSQARARLTLYWPGIDHDIENFVRGCQHCQIHLPSHVKEPLVTKPIPERPFQQIAVDLASYAGRQFLIIVDCKTDWPDIIDLGKNTTTPRIIATLRDQFCRTAVPDILWSDGGPQFTSLRLAAFLETWGIAHKFSSPHYPQSNGKAEATVKSMKKLISSTWNRSSADWEKLCRALLQYRNTPCRKDGVSPAQKLFGHPVQDHLPAHHRSFSPEWQKAAQAIEAAGEVSLQNAQMAYDQHAHTLPDLRVGAHVAIQNPNSKLWDIYGTVTAIAPFRRYFIKTQSGRVLVRNRRFLWKRCPPSVAAGSRVSPSPVQEPTGRVVPRQSSGTKRRLNRLCEDSQWMSSSCTAYAHELEGEV